MQFQIVVIHIVTEVTCTIIVIVMTCNTSVSHTLYISGVSLNYYNAYYKPLEETSMSVSSKYFHINIITIIDYSFVYSPLLLHTASYSQQHYNFSRKCNLSCTSFMFTVINYYVKYYMTTVLMILYNSKLLIKLVIVMIMTFIGWHYS